jgi:hypothetical protein
MTAELETIVISVGGRQNESGAQHGSLQATYHPIYGQRDLLGADDETLCALQSRLRRRLWRRFPGPQNDKGHWGIYYYQPQMDVEHFTLLELKNLCAPAGTQTLLGDGRPGCLTNA